MSGKSGHDHIVCIANSASSKVVIYSVCRYNFPWIELSVEVLNGKCAHTSVWKILGKNRLAINTSHDKLDSSFHDSHE